MMAAVLIPYCNGCGLNDFEPQEHGDCPRCGYPVIAPKEEFFLQGALRDLQRVAIYGGAKISVADLIDRYQVRLHAVQLQRKMSDTVSQVQTSPTYISQPRVPYQVPATVAVQHSQAAMHTSVAAPAFSLRAFLADQTINIVASLGAFLLLIGALSFVVATTNLWLSFLILCITHIVFGVGGFTLRRIRNFQVVAAIYSVIFALLLPLVGLSAYRLVGGNILAINLDTLVVIAALYAAIIYSILAVYQKFTLFGYLAAVALLIADVAVMLTLKLSLWWWPDMLLILTLPGLVALSRGLHGPFVGAWSILRQPAHILMVFCVGVCVLAACFMVYLALEFYAYAQLMVYSFTLPLLTLLVLLFCWFHLFVWRSGRVTWLWYSPYLFLLCALTTGYTFHSQLVGYILILLGVAMLYHGLELFGGYMLQAFDGLRRHMELLALVLVGVIPLVVVAALRWNNFWNLLCFRSCAVDLAMPETLIELVVMSLGLLLTISMMLRHTGRSAVPVASQKSWRWLLLFSSFILFCAYMVLMLILHVAMLWAFLGLTLAFLLVTVAVRRTLSGVWADPLDVVTLVMALLTLVQALLLSTGVTTMFAAGFAVLFYGVALYQRRHVVLMLPIAFALLALLLSDTPFWVLVCVAIGLLFVALFTSRWIGKIWASSLYIISCMTAVAMGIASYNIDTILSGIAMLLLYALLSYVVARLEHLDAGQLLVVGFGVWAVKLLPDVATCYAMSNCASLIPMVIVALTSIACVSVALGLIASRISVRKLEKPSRWEQLRWSWSLYSVALASMLVSCYWYYVDRTPLLSTPLTMMMIVTFIAIACIVMLIERLPVVVIVPALLTVWAVTQMQIPFWLQLIACMVLCIVIFVLRFIWKNPSYIASLRLYDVLALGGQGLVTWVAITHIVPLGELDQLLYIRVGAWLVLALLLAWCGLIQAHRMLQRFCYYGSGLLFSFGITALLIALGQRGWPLLVLAPATYLIVAASIVIRDEEIIYHTRIGQISAFIGALLLLTPELWISFQDNTLLSTLLLAGESLLLLLLGVITRVRLFVLCGTALVIVSALHTLFLASSGLSPSLALTMTGVFLLILATGLSLARHRLQSAWSQWK